MKVNELIDELQNDFYTGVPDSTLRPICDYLMEQKGLFANHVIAANEGNCVGIAAGYYMATRKVPIVYLQNSGIGNIANPVISLLNEQVYEIPCLFFVGWRGEPGVADEPQHRYQGEITEKLLRDMGIEVFVIKENITNEQMQSIIKSANQFLEEKKQVALVFCKGSLESEEKKKYSNHYTIVREEAIRYLADYSLQDVIVASTGKISRELFEVREEKKQGHNKDFLTVGSMGHSSSIALGIALQKKNKRIWCLDGDGALLMHMGAMALLGASGVENVIHVVFNNGAHESVGGLPTVMEKVDLIKMSEALGYKKAYSVSTLQELELVLGEVNHNWNLTFIEIKTAIGSRTDLGRPTIAPKDNLRDFMNYLAEREE